MRLPRRPIGVVLAGIIYERGFTPKKLAAIAS
jgi:hypothetical protein